MEIAWQVEIDDYCNKVLEKHWPNVRRYPDVKEVGRHNLAPVELICGGFPCQPFSVAGQQRGKDDDRALWPEMLRIIKELEPTWIIGENVYGIVNLALDDCISSLEGEGYECRTFNIPACAVGAPHRRDRIWIVANRSSLRRNTRRAEQPLQGSWESGKASTRKIKQDVADTAPIHAQGRDNGQGPAQLGRSGWWEVEPSVGRVANGIPDRVDRLKGLGNAVVPQIPEILGRMILEIESS